jgi:glycosyltransferase involved in cell wall biosynthesis
MRIAFLCQTYPPMVSGIAMAVRRMAEGLVERGHDVLVLTASDRNEPYTVEDGGLQLVRLASLPNPTRVGQRWVFWSRADVARRLDEFQPDVLHLHDPFLAGFSIPSLAREKGIPLALTTHALPWYVSAQAPDLPGLRQGIEIALWAFAQEVLGQCDVVIAPSRQSAEVIERNIGRTPVVISNGVHLGLFRPGPLSPETRARLAATYRFDPRLPILLHVGRVDVEKRVNVVVRAAHYALQRAQAQLVIVGDGKQLRSTVRLSRELGLTDRAHFVGFVPPETDLPDLYRMAYLFAIASELETEGLVVLEAAACGLPLLAVRATVMPELVEESGAGFVVEPGDAEGMGERMAELLARPELARTMGAAARRMAERHSLDDTLAAHEDLYSALLARKPVPSQPTTAAK